jgi:hypothetical protein
MKKSENVVFNITGSFDVKNRENLLYSEAKVSKPSNHA